MFYVAVINEMNIYENQSIYENPLSFDSSAEAMETAKTFVDQGYRVAISDKAFE